MPAVEITVHRRAHIRYAGTDTSLVVPFGRRDEMVSAFEAAHKSRFGFIDESKALTIEAPRRGRRRRDPG
ncbi:hypothetical protein JNW90_34875 [Micromonospora sp. STR1s_5]|nr:hypothetical protein [Micromonospora sp. STR1s_5]